MEPGIHTLSFEQYLSAGGVSASMLWTLHTGTPAHLRHAMTSKTASEDTFARRLGTEAHRALFEPDTMENAYYVKPDGMSFATKEGKAWKAAHPDRPIVTAEEYESIIGIARAFHSHPVASRLLKNADFEQSIFVTDKEGTLRKFRPDIWPKAGNILPDLKTCEDASPEGFSKAIANYGYYYKMAYYLDCARLAGRKFEQAVLVAIESKAPHLVAVYTLDPLAIDYGRVCFKKDLATYRECMESGVWPGYQENVECIGLPAWMEKTVQQAA